MLHYDANKVWELYIQWKREGGESTNQRFGQWVINNSGLTVVWPKLFYAPSTGALQLLLRHAVADNDGAFYNGNDEEERPPTKGDEG